MQTDTGDPHHRGGPPPDARVLIVALTLVVAVFLATAWRASTPPPNMATDTMTVDGERFSAARAQQTLSYLLSDQVPHTMGTEANRRVKARVIQKLGEAGVEVSEQVGLGCAQGSPHCGFVENVIGTLPGTTDDTIVLMAHYDSTTNSPGAGDDGAGVAAIIETVRLLAAEAQRRGAPYRNTIRAVITDGEEDGLFGAEAFFAEHPDADATGVLINVEGSGSAGPSNLLRSSPGSGSLVTLYRQTASQPMASSIATEIFERMPNDTDFSVGLRAGVKGLDFAFAGERTHYHTPLDTVENLDLGTLQHHGDNLLPLLRRLVEVDLATIEGEYSYTTMLDLWLQWRESLSLPLACLGALLLLVSVFLRRGAASIGATVVGIGAALIVLAGILAACALALMVANRLAGSTPGWPGTIWPWRLILLSGAALAATLLGAPAARRLGFHPLLNGVWFWMTTLAVAAATEAPLAAAPFLVPVLLMSSLMFVLSLIDRDGESVGWIFAAIAGLLGGVVYLGGLIPLLEETQGYQLAPAFYVPLALCLLLLTPLFAVSGRAHQSAPETERKRTAAKGLVAVCALGLLAAGVGLVTTPLYTEWRPQPVSLRYVQDLDRGTAKWWAIATAPLPGAMADVASFEYQEEILTGLPYSGLVAPAEFHPWPSVAPAGSTGEHPDSEGAVAEANPRALEILRDEANLDGRQVTLRLGSSRGSTILQLAVDRQAELEGVQIAGRDASNIRRDSADREYDLISVYAPPADGVEIVLDLGSRERHEHLVMDTALELPESAAPLLEARAPLAGPVHSGDRWMAIERISF